MRATEHPTQTLGGAAVTRIEGRLRRLPSGRWAIFQRGRDPWEITSGDVIYVAVAGKLALQRTRIEYVPGSRFDGDYVSMDDYPLRNGLRSAAGAD
jgi:hypothetical protein